MKKSDKKLIEQAVVDILTAIGEDVRREGLQETPERVANAYDEFFSDGEPPELKSFTNPGYDEIVAKADIPFYSFCEHHILPFSGKADIAYIPNDKMVGLSKLARIVEHFARRLQIQERLTHQIGSYLYENLEPKGVMVIIGAQHLCERMRGIETDGTMKTSAIYGCFEKESVRHEALELIKEEKRNA